MKKYYIMLLICLAGTIANAQGYLGFGAGSNNFKATIVNLQVGYQLKNITTEFEMKTPLIDTRVADPANFSFKTGYNITLAGHLVFTPQIEACYQQFSNDENKTVYWKNGWKAGVGARLRWEHFFIQGDYTGSNNYIAVGVCAQFKRQQNW